MTSKLSLGLVIIQLKGTLTSTCHEAGNVVVVETIDAFEIPVPSDSVSISNEIEYWGNVHLPLCPLYFLYNIKTAVDNELVHMPCLLWKSGYTISSLFSRPELIFEERIILSANNSKVIRHCGRPGGGIMIVLFVACCLVGSCLRSRAG